ncbi:MAG: hypothetical protein ACOYXR_13985 [Nitrospirota bacterium]
MNRTLVALGVCAWVAGQATGNAWAEDSVTQRLDRIESRLDQLGAGENNAHGGSGAGKLSFHGYGELHFNSPEGASVPDDADPAIMDLHRMVWGVSYQFNDRISVHTEVDFEHAAGEIELEFAYVDFLITPAFNVRAGSMLMPVGPLNEFHEPPLFYSVERPYVQRTIIPTSWQEGGVGLFGSVPAGLKYRVYLVSGLNAEDFTASNGIRGGRGHVNEQPSDSLAVVGRLEYVGLPGVDLGLSVYQGGANTTNNAALGDAGVGILEADARLRVAGLDLRGVLASINVDGADQISTYLAGLPTPGAPVGEEMLGWYLEAAYDVLKVLAPNTDQSVVAFLRYEDFDTQKSMPTGFAKNPAHERQVMTAGLAYFPIPDVAIKADLESWENGADDDGSRFNLGVGYQFH